ncbi:hypothetical protein KVR01_010989 [Diaporthe batatas]|uniref:uncharacterized protein n=1 Tax=Diaporthe batatas TaxID=748121 RepID=UPI001D04AEDA|nr:uncharacterized protein KVR01_010989 [Diaporthe batatas]KAG8159328.1 hypothetical protein KVR01_010989 [Diaporthe batatas]
MAPLRDSIMVPDLPALSPRKDHYYYDPAVELYAGLWCLFSAATAFLGLRVWVKFQRRHGLWWDDYLLMLSWLILLGTDILTTFEYANGYSKGDWTDSMHILINISSDGTVIGQALTKTAFAVTLLRMCHASTRSRFPWKQTLLWFCIITMDGIALSKCVFQWAKICGRHDYQQWYRLNWCLDWTFSQDFKELGNIYNIIMDFLFAIFPWFITWPLNLKRGEKIGLGVTLSLGMMIAIITAIRTWWKDTPLMHVHDWWYMWRDAVSQIWYSAEVSGTIMVQCVPVLRPFIKDLHTAFTSKRLEATEPSRAQSTWRGSTLIDQRSNSIPSRTASILSKSEEKKSPGIFELTEIPEETIIFDQTAKDYGYHAQAYYDPSSDRTAELPVQGITATTTTTQQLNGPLDSWPVPTRGNY